jgi:hypothetical protein
MFVRQDAIPALRCAGGQPISLLTEHSVHAMLG